MIDLADIGEVKRLGGIGEILGHFFSATGEAVDTSIAARTLSLRLDMLEGRRIVAIAGGKEKVWAIRSVLKSGVLSGLITDERSARALCLEETI
jgi:DNA-binding transcriptional regulator LsrR (DeoR family)